MAVLMKIKDFVTVTRLITHLHDIIYQKTWVSTFYAVFSQIICRENKYLLPSILQFSQQQNILYSCQ